MCSPTLAVTIGSTLFSAYNQMQAGKAEAKSIQRTAENNAKISEYNAKVSEQNADYQDKAATAALSKGAQEAGTIRENYRKANASGRAAAASTGFLADTGSYGDLMTENAGVGEFNALTAINNAEREAYGFKVKAGDFRADATGQRFGAQVASDNAAYQASVKRSNANGAAIGTLVTGGSSAYNSYTPAAAKLPWQTKGNVKPAWMGGGTY